MITFGYVLNFYRNVSKPCILLHLLLPLASLTASLTSLDMAGALPRHSFDPRQASASFPSPLPQPALLRIIGPALMLGALMLELGL